MDGAAVQLVSLLEGTISETEAVAALERSGGNIAAAVSILFEKRTPAPEPRVPDPPIPRPVRPLRRPHNTVASRPGGPVSGTFRRPVGDSGPTFKRFRSLGTHREATTDLDDACMLDPVSVEFPESKSRHFPPTLQPSCSSTASASEYIGCNSNEWKTVPASFEIGSADWRKYVLASDPPCLSLSSRLPEVQQVSDGKMHSSGSAPQSMVTIEPKRDIEFKDGRWRIRVSCIRDLFDNLLANVRYLPEPKLECSFRLAPLGDETGRRPKVAPEDLTGAIPERPFKLLDNRGDTPAPQPPRFGSQKLRPEQLRSFAWMLSREGHKNSDCGGSSETEPFIVEWRRHWNPDGVDETENDYEQIVEDAEVLVRLPPNELNEDETEIRGIVKSVSSPQLVGGTQIIEVQRLAEPGKLKVAIEHVQWAGKPMSVGSRVKVRQDVKCPSFGWGGVTPVMTGIVTKDQIDTLTVKYVIHGNWRGRKVELESADAVADENSRPHVVVDLRIRACYSVQGGILADKVGYGKTATTIALIDATLDLPPPKVPDEESKCFFPAKGTLIIVPSNLFDQWLSEIAKFLWEGKSIRTGMRQGWSPKGCPLRIFAPGIVTPLTKVTAEELSEADVVLCSYRLLFSPIYQDRRKELMEGGAVQSLASLVEATAGLMSGKVQMRSGRSGDTYVSSWKELQFPVLEQFHWKRVVFDEFHELESFENVQQNSLQHLRSSYRWGLTGTPPVDDNAGVIFMSSLFRTDIPGFLPGGARPELTAWESDRLSTETAGRFLDEFARQNTAELPHIRLEEHVVNVQHTLEERALYLGQAHDAPDVNSPGAFESDSNTQALERLLKLCSHFQAIGDNAATAKEECERIGEQKERRLVRAKNQVSRCWRAIKVLNSMIEAGKKGGAKQKSWRVNLTEAEQRLTKEGGNAGTKVMEEATLMNNNATDEDLSTSLDSLDSHWPKDRDLSAHLGIQDSKKGYTGQWLAFAKKVLGQPEVIRLLEGQAKEQAANLQEFLDASNSRDFFSRTVLALARDESPEARTCTICFEEGLPLTQLAITPCAHAFCMSCLKAVVDKLARCSLCNQKLEEKDIRPLAEEVPAAFSKIDENATGDGSSSCPASNEKASDEKDEGHLSKYGTKLAALVDKLQELRKDDPSAKVILFVQFDDLKRKVASALSEFGVPAVQLQGSVSQRASVIRDWQHNTSSAAFVLLLSLAQSASGTNLTAANHVVFLHPMLAATPERAVAHEMQAIGRARRHGQRKDVVHVWRFVTTGTVEEALSARHQAEMRSRE